MRLDWSLQSKIIIMQTLISLERKKSWKAIYKFKSKEGGKKEKKEIVKGGVRYFTFEFNW